MSSDRVPGTSDGVGNAASASMSNQRAEGAFDTPRSYIAAAAAGGSSSRRDDAMDWNPREEAQDGEGVGAEESEQPPSKKRKGLAGVVLSGALDAAIFTTALTYSAYQLWKNPPCVCSCPEESTRLLTPPPLTPGARATKTSKVSSRCALEPVQPTLHHLPTPSMYVPLPPSPLFARWRADSFPARPPRARPRPPRSLAA